MKKGLIFLGMALLVSLGCNQIKENVEPMPNDIPNVRIQNGRMVFANQTAFDETYKYLLENEETVDVWSKNFAGFTSHHQAFVNITEEQQSLMLQKGSNKGFEQVAHLRKIAQDWEVVETITNPFLAFIANQDGIYQVGNEVRKMTYEHLSYLYSSDEKIIEAFAKLQEKNMASFPGIKVTNIERGVAGTRAIVRSQTSSVKYNNNNNKVSCEIYYERLNSNPINSIIARAKHYKKNWLGVWVTETLPASKMPFCIQMTGSNTVFYGVTISPWVVQLVNTGSCKSASSFTTFHNLYSDSLPWAIDASVDVHTITSLSTLGISFQTDLFFN